MNDIKIILGGVTLMWVAIQYATLIIERLEKHNLIKFVCLKCWSFIFVLGYTLDPILASMSGLLGYLLDEYISKKKA